MPHSSVAQRLTRNRFITAMDTYLALVHRYGATEIRFEAIGYDAIGLPLYWEFIVSNRGPMSG